MSDRPRLRRFGLELAGPALIAGTVLLIQHGFALGDRLPSHYELLGEWLPNFCFLGGRLAAGHIPAWNPHVMGGVPFAADPLHGWLNLPAMFFFSILPCGVALGGYFLFLPILAGVALYLFLRSEAISRPAATCGGVVLGLGIAGSGYFHLPWVSGPLAWTAVMLACASKYFRTETRASQLAWAGATALAWGQVAAADLSSGVQVATLALIVYTVAKVATRARAGHISPANLAWSVALLIVALPAVNVALFLPRLAYLPRTSLGMGYRHLDALSLALSHQRGGALVRPPPAGAPLMLAFSPGLHAGAAALGLAFGGFWSKKGRSLAICFAVAGALFYVLMLPPVVRAISARVGPSVLIDSYLHVPDRLSSGLFLAVCVLAALGIEAWREARSPGSRALMLLPGVAVWGALPLVFHGALPHLLLLAAGAGLAAVALAVALIRPPLALLLPAVLAVELLINGLVGVGPGQHNWIGRSRPPFGAPLVQNTTVLDVATYLRPQPFERFLQTAGQGRYVSVDPTSWNFLGYIKSQAPSSWELLATQRSMLSGLEEAQGYNSTQLLRYWEFLRRIGAGKPQDYRSAFVFRPTPVALDLLQVRWIVSSSTGPPPVPDAVVVAREGRWALFELSSAPPRASVVTSWTVVAGRGQALDAVADPAFDPAADVVLERSPGLTREASIRAGQASYQALSEQSARVQVQTPVPAVVVVRNSYDPNWHAEVDGRPVRVLPADVIDQGIPVPAGRHTITLAYDDPWVGRGLIGSGVALALLFGAALAIKGRLRSGVAAGP